MEDKEKEELLKRINQLEKQQAKSKRNKRILLIIVLIIALAIGGTVYYLHYQAWYGDKEEIISISEEELEQYVTKVDVTLDNWLEYVVLEDVEKQNTNAFR